MNPDYSERIKQLLDAAHVEPWDHLFGFDWYTVIIDEQLRYAVRVDDNGHVLTFHHEHKGQIEL